MGDFMSKAASWLQTLVVTTSALAVGLLGILYVYQEKLLYFPSMPGVSKLTTENPEGTIYGIDYEDVFIPCADGVKIHAWLMKQPQPKEVSTIVFFHGNAGSTFISSPFIQKSWASCSIAGLILENTFLSISAMVDQVMPWLSHVKSVVLRLDWGNEGRIPLLTHPILFVAGERDELVPHTHMQRLHALAVKSTLRAWLPIPRGTHNDSWMRGGMDYFYTLKSFIGNVVGELSSVDTKAGQVKTPMDMVDDEDFKEAPSHIPNMLDQQSLLFQRPAKKIDQDEL
ncbi:hypothetical protein DYB32_001737 [Aphanomyces invadans]|uniref:Peptidase S9 prolyl oligopeptidase catalytic domain-containing protein n=1 Tax=Aphanomyces invadans TaxID=157072 RepID=A0A418B5B3_9STRA|nr:hypothetical protein DYB32_001737 [Aphanomyces invadans]